MTTYDKNGQVIKPKKKLARCKGCGYDTVCKSGYCSLCEGLYGIKHIGGLK